MANETSKLASLQNLKDTALRIKKEYLAAISKSGHLTMKKVSAVPTEEEAKNDVFYLVKNEARGHYDIYALIDGSVERVDDTTADLDGAIVATDEEVEEMFNEVFGAET